MTVADAVDDPGVEDPGVEDPGVDDPGVEDPGVDDPGVADPGGRAGRSARRVMGILAALVLLGAAGCAGAAAMTWWTAGYVDPLTGPLTLTATGADCLPELVPVALVALAGFGATLATKGLLRRLVGVVLLAGGLLVAVRSTLAMAGAPVALTAGLTRPADPAGGPVLHPMGPLIAAVGGVLVAAAGAMVFAGRAARRRLGTRYDAPSGHRSASPSGNPGGDPSTVTGDWWKALDAGTDPTDPGPSERPGGGGYHDPNERAR